jgi:hypothetical protein
VGVITLMEIVLFSVALVVFIVGLLVMLLSR